jgi:hypothetical protein
MIVRWRGVVSSTPRPLNPGEGAPGTHWIRGGVGPRAGLETVAKRKKSQALPEIEPHSPSP